MNIPRNLEEMSSLIINGPGEVCKKLEVHLQMSRGERSILG